MTEQERIDAIQWMEYCRIASDNALKRFAQLDYADTQDFWDILEAEIERRDTERRIKEKYDAQ